MSLTSDISPLIPKQYKLKFIGDGAFGEVHLIIDDDHPDEEKYVVKTVKVSEATRDRDQNIRELQILRSLDHRRIVPFFGFSQSRFELQLFMGYMRLGSLAKYIIDNEPLDIMKTKVYTAQILEGVSYLHNRKPPIIHRDIKADNVLLEDQNNLRLSDFGVSKVLTELTNARTGTGTFNFRAPETFKSGTVYNVKADIWSVGCTVLEMRTGTPPYADIRRTSELIGLINQGERPDKEFKDCPQDLKHFWDKCFRFEPSERPSADELLGDIFLRQ
ncbi:mitogen-activated protein kinase kinase kinase 2 [Biomphalaria pfeifferi]|uniref:Mitogen-activated protein kinase kinase kinase 2 n=1 Tax=Biomphalaria pfeifferi TaxID=112525 RepID=A0AAD8FJY2_BIOPF|nr:mitogen-activated protein kinase kinase kinase 2 [Biomphalaria pfeifferi]